MRYYRDDRPNELIRDGLTLEEAQTHCSDPSTSTEDYFDGYNRDTTDEEEYNGWTNRSTWLVGLWVNNDYNEYHRMRDNRPFTALSARAFVSASPLRNSMWLDGAIFDNVNWQEIADDFNEE